ncbi:MAG: hypothetical protein R3277_13580 [Brumimicrobium sp.]|nr:hypothetical protein [Brumimicrobium sp.]
MRTYLFSIFFLLLSCSGESPAVEQSAHQKLEKGKWIVVESHPQEKGFGYGIKFSPDKQYFHTDSKGQIIPTMREKVYSLSGDTLTMVDYKYEPRFRHTKGTQIFYVTELSDEKLSLKGIYPDSTVTMVLKNEEM